MKFTHLIIGTLALAVCSDAVRLNIFKNPFTKKPEESKLTEPSTPFESPRNSVKLPAQPAQPASAVDQFQERTKSVQRYIKGHDEHMSMAQKNIDLGIHNANTKKSVLLAKSWIIPALKQADDTVRFAQHHSLSQDHINDAQNLKKEVTKRHQSCNAALGSCPINKHGQKLIDIKPKAKSQEEQQAIINAMLKRSQILHTKKRR